MGFGLWGVARGFPLPGRWCRKLRKVGTIAGSVTATTTATLALIRRIVFGGQSGAGRMALDPVSEWALFGDRRSLRSDTSAYPFARELALQFDDNWVDNHSHQMDIPDAIQLEVQELTTDLFRADEMGAVIRAHIRIENLLIQTVERLLPCPRHLKSLNLDYNDLVTLALALGLKEQFGPPFRALGKLRNDFAHKLDTSISRQVVSNLYKSLGSDDKAQVQASFQRIKNDNKETSHIKRFADLEPSDQFKVIAITLWSVVRATIILYSRESSDAR